jgi:hypothetical protein
MIKYLVFVFFRINFSCRYLVELLDGGIGPSHLEGSGRGLFEILSQHLPGENEKKKPTKS